MIKRTKGTIEGEHVLITGPVRGPVVLEDGTEIDLTPAEVEVAGLDADQVDEIIHHIGMYHFENGHPDDREIDLDEDSPTHGQLVQRPFNYQPIDRFKHHLRGKKPLGVPHKKKKG